MAKISSRRSYAPGEAHTALKLDLAQHHVDGGISILHVYISQKLEGRKGQLLDEVKSIASPDKAYKNYKEKLRTINPPCVPFVGKLFSVSSKNEPTSVSHVYTYI